MTKTELLEQISSIAKTIEQVKYLGGLEHIGLVSILNDLINEYHQRFLVIPKQITATQAKFNSLTN